MESLSLIVLVWLAGLFFLVLAYVYARTFAGNPRWFRWTALAVLVLLCLPLVFASLGMDAVLVWVALGIGLLGLGGAAAAMLRASARENRQPK